MVDYEKIFSRFRGLITDINLPNMDDFDSYSLQVEYMYSAISDPRVRRLFKTIEFDDEIASLEFSLKNSIDNFSDENFVIKIISIGMAIAWLQPKVDSILYVTPMIGGKEEKKLLDNYKNVIERLKQMKVEQKQLIRDYGYLNNSYISES